jgi:hypothetical protein
LRTFDAPTYTNLSPDETLKQMKDYYALLYQAGALDKPIDDPGAFWKPMAMPGTASGPPLK